MKTTDINEQIKKLLLPFLITDWKILPSEDLDAAIRKRNKLEKEIKITDANELFWFAKGLHDSTFFLKDYSLDSKIPGVAILPTEYFGALVVHRYDRCILSASWHGYDFVMMDQIKTSFEPFPISKMEIEFCFQITQAFPLH
jgi:hypothetical protein